MSSKIKDTMLMKSNQSDNVIRRRFDQKKKSFMTNKDLDIQKDLDKSKDEKLVNRWVERIFI
jgi:hypothetical protein